MIDLYTWSTPNGRKISIMLEELGLEYTVHSVNIGEGEQHEPAFREISPHGKIPAIVDRDNGLQLMESGAILMYLARRTGRLLPDSGEAYWRVIEWLMFQMGNLGPMLGQTHHFVHFNPDKSEYARERYLGEARRLYQTLDEHLAGRGYLAGDYSIADIATWPWVSRWEWQTMDLDEYPEVKRWYCEIAKRPAVERGYHVPRRVQDLPLPA